MTSNDASTKPIDRRRLAAGRRFEGWRRESGSGALLVLLAIAFAAVVGFAAFHWWTTGEARVVKKRLDELAAILSPPADGELAMIGRIGQLRGYFAPDVHITFGSEQIDSRDALVTILGRWQPPRDGFSLRFVDVVVHMVS